MRTLVIYLDKDRPRPLVVTPAKGELGDCTIESQAESQSVDYILKKYGGNLREMAGWRQRGVYGDAPVNNLEDAFEILRNAHDDFVNHMNDFPFKGMDDALRAIGDGTFIRRVREFNSRQKKPEPQPQKPDQGDQKEEPIKE